MTDKNTAHKMFVEGLRKQLDKAPAQSKTARSEEGSAEKLSREQLKKQVERKFSELFKNTEDRD